MVVHKQWVPGGREEGEERGREGGEREGGEGGREGGRKRGGRKGGRGREEREGGRGGEVKYMSLDKQENGKINCLTN